MKASYMEEDGDPKAHLIIECPACKFPHSIRIDGKGEHNWTFNGNLESPTISPSLLVKQFDKDNNIRLCCHSFIRNGQIIYLNDCTHSMAGKTVDLLDVDDLF